MNHDFFFQATLVPFAFTHTKKDDLDEQLKNHLYRLTQEHFLHLLKASGLQPIIEALDTKPEEVSFPVTQFGYHIQDVCICRAILCLTNFT